MSRDLLHWEHLPVALAPGDVGPDSFGCWSGCIVDERPEARLFYTGVRLDGVTRVATICQARSTDRIAWAKDPSGPVVGGPPDGIVADLFRDPFVWREDGEWHMVVGGGTPDGRGAVLLYRSPNLDHWRYAGLILSSDQVDHISDGHAPMWECPQLLRIGDEHVLIVSVVDRAPAIRPSHVVAFVGRFVGDRFMVGDGRRLAMGPDFYAPAAVRTPDDRWMLFGWVPEDPPTDATDRTWAGALTFPRIVSLAPDGRIRLALAREVAAARGAMIDGGRRALSAHEELLGPDLPRGPFELALDLRPGVGADIRISLHDTDPVDPLARISYQERDRQLIIARRGIVSVAGRSSVSAETVPPDADGTIGLRILVDGSILELEANGDTMGTVRLASHRSDDRRIRITAETGECLVERLTVWPLRTGHA
jgi:beta-fructofuranosidase